MTVAEFKEDYDWRSAWDIATPDPAGAAYTMDDIVDVLAHSAGEGDGPNWLALLRMKDGNCVYLDAGCDYTGWDCQAGGFRTTNSLQFWLSPLGFTLDQRERLGPTLSESGLEWWDIPTPSFA